MPRNFTPADRETVGHVAKELPHVYQVGVCGPGLVVQHMEDSGGQTRCYSGLMREYGWYVDVYDPREGGDMTVLMPVTEVPE